MKDGRIRPVFRLLVLATVLQTAGAEAASRESRRFGLFAGYNAGTGQSSINVAENVVDWLRIQGGYAFNLGINKEFNPQFTCAAKVLVPKWTLKPYAGIGIGPSASKPAFLGGLDFTSKSGLNIGVGYTRVDVQSASGVEFYLGYYFK